MLLDVTERKYGADGRSRTFLLNQLLILFDKHFDRT